MRSLKWGENLENRYWCEYNSCLKSIHHLSSSTSSAQCGARATKTIEWVDDGSPGVAAAAYSRPTTRSTKKDSLGMNYLGPQITLFAFIVCSHFWGQTNAIDLWRESRCSYKGFKEVDDLLPSEGPLDAERVGRLNIKLQQLKAKLKISVIVVRTSSVNVILMLLNMK